MEWGMHARVCVRACCKGIKCRVSYFEEQGRGLKNTTIFSNDDGDLSLVEG